MRVQQYDYVILSDQREAIVTIDVEDTKAAEEFFKKSYPDEEILDVSISGHYDQ